MTQPGKGEKRKEEDVNVRDKSTVAQKINGCVEEHNADIWKKSARVHDKCWRRKSGDKRWQGEQRKERKGRRCESNLDARRQMFHHSRSTSCV